MDKETLSNYGWIIILVLILAVLLALASPFGLFVSDAIKGVIGGFWDVNSAALNVAGIDAGDLGFSGDTEKCGVEGHYIGDNKGPHGIPVTDCKSGHTYTCECDGWTVPNGGKYYVGVTSTTLGDYTGATMIYNAGEKLPCGYTPATGDTYVNNDYEYKYNYRISNSSYWYLHKQFGWGVRVLDDTKTTYSKIDESIANRFIVSMNGTFDGCTSLKIAPVIPSRVNNLSWTFNCCESLEVAPIIPDSVTDMSYTFRCCSSLITPPDMSNAPFVWYMKGTFSHCKSLTTAPQIPNSVTSMIDIFAGCNSLKTYIGSNDANGDFSNYIIPHNVTDIEFAFQNCTLLKTPPIIPNNVKNMRYTFYGCTSLTTPPKIPSNVTNMEYTFYNCIKLTNPPDMSNATSVTNMEMTFSDCTSLATVPIIPSSVTNMNGTFYECTSLKTAPVIPSNVTDMSYTFYECTSLTTVPIIPSSVTDMKKTFYNCTSLTGKVKIDANPLSYSQCFYGVDFYYQNLTLNGDTTILDTLGSTGWSYCSTCNGKCLNNH